MIEVRKYNKFIQKLSSWVLARNLKKSTRISKTCPLQNAKNIGITFVATSPSELSLINNFIKELNSRGAKTFALGYIPEKKPDDFFLSDKTINFFYDKELDWLYRSKNIESNNFQETEFDILIDINSNAFFPMQLLLHKSKALFKVGKFTDNSPFDFMIDVKKSTNLQYYFDQVIHYLLKFK